VRVSRTSLVSAYPVALLGIASFSIMDMVIKGLTLAIGTFATLWWRSLIGVALAGAMFFWFRNNWPTRPALRIHLVRGVATTLMAVLFFWGLARVPMAQAVALTFVAPLLSLLLAGLILKERIGARIVGGSLVAFVGVVVILAGQARADLGPDALRGSTAILLSAMIYAWNIILMRQQALAARPVEIAFFQNLAVCATFLAVMPLVGAPAAPHGNWWGLIVAALLALVSQLTLAWAYARGGAAFLSSTEYSSFLWAMLLGWLRFGEQVSPFTLAGAVLIVAGCIVAARTAPHPVLEASA
jgi:S-adenosylmethionine uptake transporter